MTVKIDFWKIFPYLIIAILIILLVRGCSAKNADIAERDNFIEALNDTLKTWVDDDGLTHSSIQVIETTDAKMFLDLQTKDSVIKELQEEVRKYRKKIKNQGSVTVLNTVTKFDTVFRDRILPDTCKFEEKFKDNYLDIAYGVNSESNPFFSLKTYDKYTIVIGEDKVGKWPFKKKKPYVEVINSSPYTQTKTLRTYQTLQKQKRFGVGPQIGFGLTTDLQFRPYFGVGIQYSLLRF